MISVRKMRGILRKLKTAFEGEWFGTYEAKEYLEGSYDEIFNRFQYMNGHNFLTSKMVNGSKKFCITSKGFKFIEKDDEIPIVSKKEIVKNEEKVVDKVNKGKSELVQIRENRILKFIKGTPEVDKFQIQEYLTKYENITADSVYQCLRPLVEDGTLVMRKQGKKNIYSLSNNQKENMFDDRKLEKSPIVGNKNIIPGFKVNLKFNPDNLKSLREPISKPKEDEPIPEIDNSVKIHEPEEVLNYTTTASKPAGQSEITIGQILDLVWPHSTSAECRKPSGLVNHDHDAVVARFPDQQTLLQVFNSLPLNLQNSTKITIENKQRKIQLFIPLTV